jgi:hypothetical protein
MDSLKLIDLLDESQKGILKAVKSQAEKLLGHTPRFKFFTLHGKEHLDSLFRIADLLVSTGVKLSAEEAFLLSLSICVHDLGMVVPLQAADETKILEGKPVATDPAVVENFIRDTHHNLAELYFQQNAGFLTACGLSVSQLSHVMEISRCHRKVVMETRSGFIKYLGALLRVIDELDLSRGRAPIAVFRNTASEMDATATWHWFKHNIVDGWAVDHNVFLKTVNGRKTLEFKLIVHPSRQESIPYWLHQIRRPIIKALKDDGCAKIIHEKFGLDLDLTWSEDESSVFVLDESWAKLEELALSAGRKVILVIDDEFRKLEDLFIPLMDSFHLMSASNAKDGLEKLAARKADLVIIDMQVGSGFIWTEEETSGFKRTGSRVVDEISRLYPESKMGVLTGSKHSMEGLDKTKLCFFLRKPVDPDVLSRKVTNVLR